MVQHRRCPALARVPRISVTLFRPGAPRITRFPFASVRRIECPMGKQRYYRTWIVVDFSGLPRKRGPYLAGKSRASPSARCQSPRRTTGCKVPALAAGHRPARIANRAPTLRAASRATAFARCRPGAEGRKRRGKLLSGYVPPALYAGEVFHQSCIRHLEFFNPAPWGPKLRTTRRAKLSQMRTLRVYAGKRFVIHAVQADWSRATTAAAVSP